jgi:AraC-like DNA-binding protein
MGAMPALNHGQAGFCTSFAGAVINYVLSQKGDTALVISEAGYFPPSNEPRAGLRVTARRLSAALDMAAISLGDEHAGLHSGMGVKPSHLGALGYAAMTGLDGISAIRLFEELQRQFMTEAVMRHEIRGAFVQTRLDPSEGPNLLPGGYPFWSFFLACRLNFIRGACGRHAVPERIALPCPPPTCDRAIRAFVGAPVDFNARAYGELFPSAVLMDANPQSSPEIHLVMMAMARRAWRDACDPDTWMVSRLKRAIHQALEQGDNPTLGSLVPKLALIDQVGGAINARQLQRKLAEYRRSFRDVVGEVRRERALAQLRSTDRPLADIAAEAGYAELSSFHRAVRRWTGLTPMRIRKEGVGCQEV